MFHLKTRRLKPDWNHKYIGIQSVQSMMWNWSLLVGTVVAAIVGKMIITVAQLWKRCRDNQRETSGIPMSTNPHWLWGHLKYIDPNVTFDSVRKWMRQTQYGMFQVWFGPAGLNINLHCHHSDTLQPILVTAEPKSEMYKLAHGWIGKGLISSEGKLWGRDRRLLTPAFHFDILKQYVQEFNASAQSMLDSFGNKLRHSEDTVELFEAVSAMTLDSLLRCTFSVCDKGDDDGVLKKYLGSVNRLTALVIERVMQPLVWSDVIYSLTANGREWRNLCDFVHGFAKGIIRERKAQLSERNNEKAQTKNERKHLDFLDMLLAAKDEEGRGLSENQILDQVNTFMFAGHDTTASAISFCLYNLAKHPEHQNLCREEVSKVLAGRDAFKWEDLSCLHYLTMCIKESLRIDPPVPETGRRTINPLTIKDRIFPKGSWFTVAIFGVHHNPSVWHDPETYDPRRFSSEQSRDRSPYAFIPFSAGPRNCIGQNFAMNELKIAVGLTLLQYRLDIVPEKPCIKQSLVITRAKEGLWVKLTPVNDLKC